MVLKEVEAKSILRKHKKIDSWFISRYGMNLYRGCQHACAYCDGQAESYYVESDFSNEVEVKVNAPRLLRRELDPSRKRKPFKKGFVMLGGGVSDSYQPVEKKYRITREALNIIKEFNFPVHVLTKSTAAAEDLAVIKAINKQSRAVFSMSFSSVDERLSSIFEPGVPPPEKRLQTLRRFKDEGIAAGMFLMPVIPFVTDTAELMEEALQKASEYGLDYVVFGGMTLKDGRQKNSFFNTLEGFMPELISEYDEIYTDSKWGNASSAYYKKLHKTFYSAAKKYKIPLRIPAKIFEDILDTQDLAVVILEQLDYLLKLKGSPSSFSHAAYTLSKINLPLSSVQDELRSYRGIGPKTMSLLKQIFASGRCQWYEKELYWNN